MILEREYVARVSKHRTTLIRISYLFLIGRIGFGYGWNLLTRPVEVVLQDYSKSIDGEEYLTSQYGLKLIAKHIFTTWDGYVVDDRNGKVQVKKWKL